MYTVKARDRAVTRKREQTQESKKTDVTSITPDKPTNSSMLDTKELSNIKTMQYLKLQDLPLLIVMNSVISLYSWEEMKAAAVMRISNAVLTGHGTVNDPRLGPVDANVKCAHCGLVDCPGHFALIEFDKPILHPVYLPEIVSVLSCVCNNCGGILINKEVLERRGVTRLPHEKRLAAVKDLCTSKTLCTRNKPQLSGGIIKDCGKNPTFDTSELKKGCVIHYKLPSAYDKSKAKADGTKGNILTPEAIYSIFNAISDEDADLLGFNDGHPRNLIWFGCLVPPTIARPPQLAGGSIEHDQITVKYAEVFRKSRNMNAVARKTEKETNPQAMICSILKDMIFKTEAKKNGPQAPIPIVGRFQGKHALIRESLMGKRVDYCGRTVLGPDASLYFGELGTPDLWKDTLTVPDKITDFNIHRFQDELEDPEKDVIKHILSAIDGLRRPANKNYELQIGDVVSRLLRDGDLVTGNRQPTLHKTSLMGFDAKLGDHLTMRFHISYTPPLNADFDGDEGNMAAPQDLEVQAEIKILLHVTENILSPEQNRPAMALVMNSISGAYLMTDSKTRINNVLFQQLMELVIDQENLTDLHARLTKYGVHPRSGAAAVSALFPRTFTYANKGITIYEGVLVDGQLKKSTVGPSHRSIVQDLHKEFGSKRTAQFLSDAPWVINKWLIESGFTVGLLDMINLKVDKDGVEYDENEKVLREELAAIDVQIEALGGKLEDPIEEDYRRKQIKGLLNVAQGIGIRLAKKVLSKDNAIGVMTEDGAGTKGANANIGQMMGAVGQQYYHGEPLPQILSGGTRLLPTSDYNDLNPVAGGFIAKSLFMGVSPEDLFNMQAGGREGLMDTGLKTAETGAMQHKMIKAFENVRIASDGSVRNALGTMFSPMYGAGYDVSQLMMVETPGFTEFASFCDVKAMALKLNVERGWVPNGMNRKIVKNRHSVDEEMGIKVEKKKYKSQKQNDQFIVAQFKRMEQERKEKETLLKTDVPEKAPIVNKAYNVDERPSKQALQPPIKLTKFEKTRVIGTRATQLANNAPPLIDIGDEINPLNIAIKEYEAGVLNLYVKRSYSDGSSVSIPATKQYIR
jgi:DNA-directed RNA polymerase II subunit RPB1